jgi:hypothetical protein
MFLPFLLATAQASDHGLQRIYDREVECAYDVDPKPDPSTCRTQVRREPPTDDRPTWAISIAPPGKLFVSHHMPAIDWGNVAMMKTPRAFEPILLSVGLAPSAACDSAEEVVGFTHVDSTRGAATHQVCSEPPWSGHGEVLLEAHRKLPRQSWIPVWAHVPDDPELAADIRKWFIVQIYISMDGTTPERPPQHPFASVALLRGAVPSPLPPKRPRPVVVENSAP